jgi:hypothetical protein
MDCSSKINFVKTFWTSSAITPKEALMIAKAAAKKALEIDNTLAEAHVFAGGRRTTLRMGLG